MAHIREVDAILHVARAFQNDKVPHVHNKINPAQDIEVVNLELELAGIKKPTIYVLNVSEQDLGKVEAEIDGIKAIPIAAKLEAEIGELEVSEQQKWWEELGVSSGLDRVIKASYQLLNLITFFTVAGGVQAQAWPVKTGTKMIEAAQIVHTDFAANFIKAEVISWDKLVEVGGLAAAREKGLIKTSGRDEEVSDGDVIEFKI